MRSEEIYSRLLSGGAVLTAIEADGDRVARLLEERYGEIPTLPEGSTSPHNAKTLEEMATAFSYRKHFDHLSGDLKTVLDALPPAEDELLGLRMAVAKEVHQRDDIVGPKLWSRFLKVRHALETLYSETQRQGQSWRPGFVLASVAGATPRTPRRFLEQVRQTEDFLREPAVEPPSLDLNGVKVDFIELANDLKPLRKAYSELLDRIDRLRKQAQGARVAKDKAIEKFNLVFLWVARAFESLFHLAGEHELAELIRPSVRRPGLRKVDEDAETSGEGSSEGEESPAEGSSTEASTREASSSKEAASPTEESPSTEASSVKPESSPAAPASSES